MIPPKIRRDVDFHWDLDRLEAGIKPPDPVGLVTSENESIRTIGLDESPMEALHGFEGARLLRMER